MKPLSQNKQRFLGIVKAVNQHLDPDYRLSKDKAIEMYDREISPYGYPTNQSILIREGLTMLHYNTAVLERRKLGLSKEDEDRLNKSHMAEGEGFGLGDVCPNYYITQDLAKSLIETKTPENASDIDLEVLPTIKVVFPKKFSELSTIAIQQRNNGIWVQVCFWQIGLAPSGSQGEKIYFTMEYFIPFDGTGHCMLCDTREYMEKHLLEKNYVKMKYATQPEDPKYLPKCVGTDGVEISMSSPVKLEDKTLQDVCKNFVTNLDVSYNFVINLLCLLTHEPEIITVQKAASKYVETQSRGFNTEKVNNVPNVHWLGEHFTTRVVDSTPKEGEPQGCSPKKSHWRRGHWHTILQGPGRKQRTMKWFKPTFIRGHKQTEEVSK